MKSHLFNLRSLTWLITVVFVFTLACQPEAEVEPSAADAAGELSGEVGGIIGKAPAPEKAGKAAEAVGEETAEEAIEKAPETAAEPPAEKVAEAVEKAVEEPAEVVTEAPAEQAPEAVAELVVEPEAETAVGPDKTEVAVTINGADITEGQIEEELMPQLERVASRLPAEFLDRYKTQLRERTLEKIIVEKLLDEKVEQSGIVITDEDVITHLEQTGAQQQPPMTLEDIKALTEARGQDFEQTKQRIKKGMGYQKLMEAHWTGDADVTEEDAQKYYSENEDQFKKSEQVRASHILIKPDTSDPNIDPAEAGAQAKAKAEELLVQVREGADFATLAGANSGCPSARKGGDLGPFGKGRMVRPFEEAAFNLKVGQVSDVVQTKFGYHIIKLTDRQEAEVITFEQAKDDILKMLKQKKQDDFTKQYVESLKAEASIIYPPGKEPKQSDAPGEALPVGP